jgi:uncharacterized OB-fold protein
VERSPAEVYAEHCRRRELAYQLDERGRPVFRPRVGFDAWRVSAGRGSVYAATVMRRRGAEPESLVLVDLDEGFRMMSRVVGTAPEAVAVGARVCLDWIDGDGDDAVPVPVFRLDDGGGA